MGMPRFTAEFSLYNSEKSYRLTAGSSPHLAGQMVTPQYYDCRVYADGSRYCCDLNSDFCWWITPWGPHLM
jgi:hypothetical protein